MKTRVGLCWGLWLAYTSVAGQSATYSTDTSYVRASLKQGEAIEVTNPQQAIDYYKRAYEVAKRVQFNEGYFQAIRLYTYALNNVGQHEEAWRIGQEAVAMARTDTSHYHKSLGYFAMANTRLHENKLKEAIPLYNQAAQLVSRSHKPQNAGPIYQNIGLIYERQRLYPQAIDYFRRALAVDERDTADRRAIGIDYFSLAIAYSKQGKPDSSKAFYRKAQTYINPKKDADFAINLYNNLGYEYAAEAAYDSALYYQQEALRLSRAIRNPRHEQQQLMIMAQTYNGMKQYAKALQLLDQAKQMADRNKATIDFYRNIYREYAVATEGMGRFKDTAKWMDLYIGANDSIVNQETKTLLQDYEVKIKQAEAREKLAEKQTQIAALEAGRRRQQLWLIGAGLSLLIVALIAGWTYSRQRHKQREAARQRELDRLQAAVEGQQKERLRISKELHDDLGASLTSIGLLSEVVKARMGPDTAPEIEKISGISVDMVSSMNEIIWSLNTKNDSLNGLIAYIRAYASEFLDNLAIPLQTDVQQLGHEVAVRGGDRRNIFLTVKEALNNAVKHAHPTLITLVVKPQPTGLTIEVSDNGSGFAVAAKTAGGRNGLGNMQTRMAESGGDCTFLSSPAGTTVTIWYPFASS